MEDKKSMMALQDIFQVWLSENRSVKPLSADEILLEETLTPSQKEWLEAFMVLWENIK